MGTHQIRDVEWRSKKSKELFYYLLCNQRPVSNEEILEALWPETSVNFSDSVIKTSIYRLRQALFYDCVLVEDTGYRISQEIKVQFDVEEFRSLLAQAGRLDPDDTQREEILRRAIEIYEGPFLHGCYSDWCELSYGAPNAGGIPFREVQFPRVQPTSAKYHRRRPIS